VTSPLADVSLNLVETIDDAMALKRWLGERHDGPVAVDTESGGLSPWKYDLRMVQFGDKRTGWAVPWERWGGAALEILRSYRGDWAAHNGVHDWKWLSVKAGYDVPWERFHDTLTMARIDDPKRPNGLKPLGSKLVDRRAMLGQKALDEGMSANKWTWATVPIDYPPYWCVPKTTEILTRRGWVSWDELQVGDETLGYQDGRNAWTRVTAVNTPGVAETVRLGNDHWGTICTPDHRWVMQKGKTGTVQTLPLVEGWKDKGTTKLILSAPAAGGSSPLSPDDAAVLAWLLSDGHIQWQRPSTWTSPIAKIIQKPGIYAAKIRDLLHRVGAYRSEYVHQRSGCLSFYVAAPYVTQLWLDAGLRDGSLVDLVLNLTPEARAAWVAAWIDAEGTKGRNVVSQKDGPKAEALAISLYLEGYAVDIQRTQDGVHSFHYTKRRPTPQKTKITPHGPVDVWCPTTELGTWTARDADGNIFLTGNCYSALDPVITAHIYDHVAPRVAATAPQAYDIERAANRICTKMMMRGMQLDVPYIEQAIVTYEETSAKVRAWLASAHSITSPASSGQIRRAFEALGQETLFWTEKGQPQYTKETLGYYRDQGVNPAVKQLATYLLAVRRADKMPRDYLHKFLDLRDAGDILRMSINVMGADTGRMSISEPPLQQLSRDEKAIRGSFVPRDGMVYISCDLSQVEMRGMAHFSGDEGLIDAFHTADRTGADFFTVIASELYREQLTKKDPRRQLTKNFCYARGYGAGNDQLASMAGVPLEDVQRIEAMFDERFPGMKKLMDTLEGDARRMRFAGQRPGVALDSGRFIPCDPGKEFRTLNYRIQGWAAEYMKTCLVHMEAAGLGDNLLLPVHDEIVAEVPEGQADEALRIIEECMTNTTDYSVSMTAGGEIMRERWHK